MIRRGRILMLSLLVGGTLSSCLDNLLNTTSYEAYGSENMWTTANSTTLGMNAIYAPLIYGNNDDSGRQLYQSEGWTFSGMRRDNVAFVNGTVNSTTGVIGSIFKDIYTGIHRANDAIANIPTKSPISDEEKASYIAEAKFLRAYYYSRLNMLFKGVPVYLEPIALNDMTKGRETEDKVWEIVINDLTDAINEPNFPDRYKAKDTNYGRATKGAAYALRGKVYLYTKQYDKAIADFKEVEKVGYNLFQGGYKALFKEANEQCDEMIFSIQYSAVSGYGCDTQKFLGGRSIFGGTGWNVFHLNSDFVDYHENKDGSKFNWDDVFPGYSAMSPLDRRVYFLRDTVGIFNKYLAFGNTPDEAGKKANALRTIIESKLNEMSTNVRALYLAGGNEARIRAAYINRDPRLEANVITPYAEFKGAVGGAEANLTWRFPYSSEQKPLSDLMIDGGSELFLYLHRKFVYEGINEIVDRQNGGIDFPIIRYADVLLMWAEALIMKDAGINAEAISLINKVRDRAGVALLNTSSATTVKSKDDLIERLRYERRVELTGEGINYFDERRWGTLKDMVFYNGGGNKYIWGQLIQAYTWPGDHYYAWPIPQSEVQRNPNIIQNPGWDN